MEPFRFVHAAQLLLDHQLQGTGELPGAIRPIVEDATLIAWDRIVETCLAERADLLLLAGMCVDPLDQTLRGQAALIHGLERLAEQGITAVLWAGSRDLSDSWSEGFHWPATVVRIEGADEIPVLRDGKLLAIVHADADEGYVGPHTVTRDAPWRHKLTSTTERPFRIGLTSSDGDHARGEFSTGFGAYGPRPERTVEFDYHATSGSSAPRTVALGENIIHDCGSSQAMLPKETGARGCSLITVDANGRQRRRFIPTAPVRFEQLGISVTAEQSRDDILIEMVTALEQLPRHSSDRVWLIAWNIRGTAAALQPLADLQARTELFETLHSEHGIQGVHIHTQTIRLCPVAQSASAAESLDDVLREFDRRLVERLAQPQWALQRCLDESRLHGGPWESPLRSLLAEFDVGEIARDARNLGLQWLADEEVLSS